MYIRKYVRVSLYEDTTSLCYVERARARERESIYGPRRWKRSNCAGNSRPSNGANRRPRSSYSRRRQIPAAAGVVPARAAGTGGMARSAAAAEAGEEVRNAEVASSGAALPSPPPDTAKPPPTETAAAAPAAAVDCASPLPAASNQSRSIASYLSLSITHCINVKQRFRFNNQ
jgi:hypothetical protein